MPLSGSMVFKLPSPAASMRLTAVASPSRTAAHSRKRGASPASRRANCGALSGAVETPDGVGGRTPACENRVLIPGGCAAGGRAGVGEKAGAAVDDVAEIDGVAMVSKFLLLSDVEDRACANSCPASLAGR